MAPVAAAGLGFFLTACGGPRGSPAPAPERPGPSPTAAPVSPAASAVPPSAAPPAPARREGSPKPAASATGPAFRSFSLSVLSRGKGVPAQAREAMRKTRELIEGDRSRGLAVKVETTRLGIEGETRLCAEYEDAKAAARAFNKVSALVKGVDLANLAVEPCGKAGPGVLQKGEERP